MIIEGSLVCLRPLTSSDFSDFNKWHNNPDVSRFLGMNPLSKESCLKLFNSYLSDEKGAYFGIQVKNSDQLIGYTFLTKILKIHRVARELGIVIGDPKFWGQGYGTEASILLTDYGFNNLGLHRIELLVLDFNSRARYVYEKIGFTVEGVQREARYIDGSWHDVYMMAKLSDIK